jgi:hypothetical protein
MAAAFDEALCLRLDPWGDGKGDDPYRVLSDRIVTGRKPHQCAMCMGAIEAGQRHRARREVQIGYRERVCATFRLCPECCSALVASCTDCGDALIERVQLGDRRTRERIAAA